MGHAIKARTACGATLHRAGAQCHVTMHCHHVALNTPCSLSIFFAKKYSFLSAYYKCNMAVLQHEEMHISNSINGRAMLRNKKTRHHNAAIVSPQRHTPFTADTRRARV
jgi:hypothetical protein